MIAHIILPASLIGAISGFLLLKWASRWNAETLDTIARITRILVPLLFIGTLCVIFALYPLVLLVGYIGAVLIAYTLVEKRIIPLVLPRTAWHILVTVTVGVVLATEGLLASAAAGGMPSGAPDFCYAIGHRRATAAIISGLKTGDSQARASAAHLLQDMHELPSIHDSRATRALITLFADPDPNTRIFGQQILGGIRDNGTTNALIAALDDNDPFVCAGAANALAVIGDKRAIPAVRAADAKHHYGNNCAYCNALRDLGANETNDAPI